MDVEEVIPQKFGFNWLERQIAVIAPGIALKRAKTRMVTQELKRAYDMAGRGRRTKGWRALGGSANSETILSLSLMRNRSRDLTRNNAYGKRAIQAIATNVVGSGIRPRPTGMSDNAKQEIKLKEVWAAWADSTDCDYDGLGNLYSLQHLAMRCIAESGEVLIRRRRVRNMDIPLQLQVLEPDFLDHSKNTVIAPGEPYSIQGVEFDKDGKRTGYWLFRTHPGEGMVMQSELVSADEVQHVYFRERPGQVRGVPFGASSAISLYDFEEYEQAQLIRQKIAACFAIFVEDPSGDMANVPNGDKQQIQKVEPGMIEHLSAGKKVTFSSPPSVQNYDEYTTSMLRKIAVGFGVSYEVLSGDLSNVNFSSGRMGWIEFGRLVTAWQTLMLVPMFCDPVWKWFLEAAMVAGKVRSKNTKASWTPPRREMIDPIKEINGMSKAIRNGLHSWSDTVRQLGQDPQEVLDEIIKERKWFSDNELLLECDPSADPTRMLPGDQLTEDGTSPEGTLKKSKKK